MNINNLGHIHPTKVVVEYNGAGGGSHMLNIGNIRIT